MRRFTRNLKDIGKGNMLKAIGLIAFVRLKKRLTELLGIQADLVIKKVSVIITECSLYNRLFSRFYFYSPWILRDRATAVIHR